MKAYNLNASNYTASFGTVECLQLGETGRGRKLTLVRCPKGIVDKTEVNLFAPKVGKPKITIESSDNPNWLARVSTSGAYIRGANGNVRVLKVQENNIKVIAKGEGAFGDAGRTGSWDDFLLEVAPDTVLRVKPSRGDAYFLHFTEESVVKLTASELGLYGLDIPTDIEYTRL